MVSRLSIQLSRGSAAGLGTGDGGSPSRRRTWSPLWTTSSTVMADDAAERLCVEQDDGGRDPSSEWQVVAGQEAAEQLYLLVLRERYRLAEPRRRQSEAPVTLLAMHHIRKARMALRRPAGVIVFLSARVRSRGRTSQVAKRRTNWAWSGSAMSARWPTSHRSNEQICLSTAGSTPQAIRSSRRWLAARQSWRVWNASWVRPPAAPGPAPRQHPRGRRRQRGRPAPSA